MPKMKTHKGLKKRVKITGTGKVKRQRCNGGHLLSNKSSRKLRSIKSTAIVKGAKARAIRTLLGA
ncbi:50S ribosomal protein L35 [Anaerohalosphaeraceae bacterium U12dextr]|jgi:large subunit ribosomal protein L35